MAVFEIPITPATPQSFSIVLSQVQYRMTLLWRATVGWVLDISDSTGVALVQGIALVTGADLLAQYRHIGFVGKLLVQTDHDTDAVPTFTSLGDTAHLYYVTED